MTVSIDHERRFRIFEREARAASLLRHPNIVTVHDVGRDDDMVYIATKFVDGETLRQRLERGPMTFTEVVDVAGAVAGALAAAHDAWLVHRDITPENIAIRNDGVVKVLGFGVSTLVGDLGGTLHYLSPEQVRGDAIIDHRSDIFSLGVVLYEMLAGRVPFAGNDAMSVLAQIVERDPDPLPALVPETLREVVMQSLRKSIYERPQTASDVLTSLMQVRLDFLIRERSRTA